MKRLSKERAFFFVWTIGLVGVFGAVAYSGLAAGGSPPTVSNILIESVSKDSAVISWKTSDAADSQINYGLSNDYGIVRSPFADKKSHEITLTDLEPATTYHFRVVSSNEYGDQSVSGDFTLTTEGVVKEEEQEEFEEKIEETDQQQLAAKALAIIDQITDPDALVIISEKVNEVAERVLVPPLIIGTPRVEEIGETYVVITWRTDRESNSLVSFVSESGFDPNAADPYVSTQGNSEETVLEHRIEIVGLRPSTTYHFKVFSKDILGLEGKGRDETFTTSSPIPVIRDLRLVKVEETAATISWSTTVPAAGYVEYTNESTKQVRVAGSTELVSGHTVRLNDLVFGTRYTAIVRAENENGDKVVSDPISFITVRDEYPPAISKVTNESTLYPSSDNKIQTIVSWETDELAYCQFFYRQGLSDAAEELSLDAEKEPTTEHVQVVVEFLPSTVYKFWIECHDEAENEAKSDDFVLFTPEKEKSIIDIILENFSGTFGWVKNIGK